jgi:hypothetical protein
MTDRLWIAYGLMFLMAVALAAVIWWNIHHSDRRTYRRRLARERKRIAATELARREPAVGANDSV